MPRHRDIMHMLADGWLRAGRRSRAAIIADITAAKLTARRRPSIFPPALFDTMITAEVKRAAFCRRQLKDEGRRDRALR